MTNSSGALSKKRRSSSWAIRWKQKTDQGAIVSQTQLEKVKFYVDLAQKKKAARLRSAVPHRPPPNDRCGGGYFFPPTVITGLPVGCRVNREEIFGPVVTITPFDSEEEVIGYANDTEYGLSSSVWTQNLNRAHRVAEQIHTGTVWVNCWLVRDLRVPFGGHETKRRRPRRRRGSAPIFHRAKERLYRAVTCARPGMINELSS